MVVYQLNMVELAKYSPGNADFFSAENEKGAHTSRGVHFLIMK